MHLSMTKGDVNRWPMVSAVDCRRRGLGSRPMQGIVLCSWAKTLYFNLENCEGSLTKCLGGQTRDELASHPGNLGLAPPGWATRLKFRLTNT